VQVASVHRDNATGATWTFATGISVNTNSKGLRIGGVDATASSTSGLNSVTSTYAGGVTVGQAWSINPATTVMTFSGGLLLDPTQTGLVV
jgi:hypothetical protein